MKKKIFSFFFSSSYFPSSRLLTWNQITYRYDDRSTDRPNNKTPKEKSRTQHTLSSFWVEMSFFFLFFFLLVWLCVCCSLDYTQQLVRLTSQWRRLSGWFGISKNTRTTYTQEEEEETTDARRELETNQRKRRNERQEENEEGERI
jgi:hypothetical protein